MLVFIRDQWFQLRERHNEDGSGTLEFMYPIPVNMEGYFSLWGEECAGEEGSQMATKILPFSGHQNGVYQGVVVWEFDESGPQPPNGILLHYNNKIIQKTKPQ